MNIGAESAIYMKESFIICHYQVDKLDYPDIDNIDHINEDFILL